MSMVSYDNLEDWCVEFINLKYVLEELHHYTSYDVDSVKKEFHEVVEEINKETWEIINSKWYSIE